MPNLPDIPGTGLITGMTKRTRMIVGAAGAGALAVGGLVAKRVLGHGGDDGPDADPVAEAPTGMPDAEEKAVPKPKPAKPKPPKAAPPKPKADKPKPAPKPKTKKHTIRMTTAATSPASKLLTRERWRLTCRSPWSTRS